MSETIRTLTGIRGYLALWVVVHHMFPLNDGGLGYTLGFYAYDRYEGLQPLAQFGNFAVDAFIMLSGFLMSMHYFDSFHRHLSLKGVLRYLTKRLARIYPAYAVSLVWLVWLNLAFGWDNTYANYDALSYHITLTYGWWVYPAAQFGESWNLPGWSVSTEFFTYLVFPLAALLYRPSRAAALAGFILTMLLWRDGIIYQFLGEWAMARSLGDFMLGFFLYQWRALGMFACLVRHADLLAAAALLVMLGNFWHFEAINAYVNAIYISYLGMAAALFCLPHCRSGTYRIFAHPVSGFLGKISYSIYALHFPVLLTINLFQPEIHHFVLVEHNANPIIMHGVHVLAIGAIVAASAVSYACIERPTQQWVLRWLARRS